MLGIAKAIFMTPSTRRYTRCVKHVAFFQNLQRILPVTNQVQQLATSTSKQRGKLSKPNRNKDKKVKKGSDIVHLVDLQDNFVAEMTYLEAKRRALKENMKLYDTGKDLGGKYLFKYITGKELFELSMAVKNEKRQNESTQTNKMKLISLSSKMMEHDLDIKLRGAIENLKNGNSVKIKVSHSHKMEEEERKKKEKEFLQIIEEKYLGKDYKIIPRDDVLCVVYPDNTND